jgi:hypothetical protein
VTEAEESARNKAVVTQFFERMNAGDLDGSFGLPAVGVQRHLPRARVLLAQR